VIFSRGPALNDGERTKADLISEIEELRKRVSEIEASRDEQKEVEKAVRAIANGISTATGTAFFRSVVKYLAKTLNVEYAIVGELSKDGSDLIKTLAVCDHGRIVDNFEYSLANSPCENVVGQSLRCYPRGVRQQFPLDDLLSNMDIESYIGTPLFDSAKRAIGILNVLDSKPLENPKIAQSMLRIFAVRASAELERKQSEETLHENEEKFRRIIDTAQEGVWMLDAEGRTTYVNERMAEMLGYGVRDFVGRSPFDFLAEEDRVKALESFERRKHKVKDVLDLRFLRKDGSFLWGILSASPIFDAKGRFVGSFGMVTDITKRKNAEVVLRVSEEKYRVLFENAIDPIFITDADLKYIDVNNKAIELFGFSRKEFLKMHILDVIPPEQIPRTETELKKLRERGTYEKFVGKMRSKDGRWLDVEVSSSAIVRDGKVVGSQDIVRDITERRRVEEELLRSKTRYYNIFNTAAVSLWEEDISELRAALDKLKARGVADLRSYLDEHPEFLKKAARMIKILDVNDVTLKLYRAKSKEDMLNSLDKIVTPESYDVFKDELVAIAEGKMYFEAETVNKTLLGENIHIWISLSIPSHEPAINNMLVSVIDITEHMKMEEELIKAQKLEAVGLLAGGIAHDFNNLLMAITGNIELAKMFARPGDSVYEKLTEAERAALRARDLTQQLLTFSRGGQPVRKAASIAELIRESARFSLRGSNVRCELSLPDDLMPVEVDEGQMSQVVNNLIINADQAMPDGGIIAIQCRTVDIGSRDGLPLKAGKYVHLSIKDQGIGIPREHFSKIFDPYFTTKQKGSGLGLATTYSIIKQHDGYITLESVLGAGTTFHLYIPASKGQGKAGAVKDDGPVPGNGKILVMDDDEAIRDVTGAMLRKLGYETVPANEGAEAIDLYEKARKSGEPFDAVIMDLTIPGGMGGREAIRKLLEIAPDAKAIVSSGYSNDPIMADYAAYGFAGVVGKPYKLKELSETVFRVVNLRAKS
jgi:PAS domain S-box-containing protein